MSNYVKSTNFTSKDSLASGNPLKIVKGSEIDTEFNNIATAISTKTDNASAAITGGSIVGITDLAVADGGTGASSFTSGALIKGNGTSALSAASAADIVSAIGSTAVTNAINATTSTNLAGGGAGQVPYQTASGTTAMLSAGTSGQLLQSNGASAPSWVAAPAGGFSNMAVFTSSSTWTVPAGVTKCKVIVVGGGGGGGTASTACTVCGGGGGGGGGVAIKIVTGLTPGGTVSVTVGSAGNTSSFGAYCSATGGASAPATNSNAQGAPGAGGTGSSGDINIVGMPGSGGSNGTSGSGGSSVLGGGARGVVSAGGLATGLAATGYGGGGSGGASNGSSCAAGGAGTGGIVMIEY